ncbi:hypothetical protein [Pararhodospirillum oryzae]|uniref:Lipoprotein n=1 Tax=Pararhodospirillum oryzae TaxID=478448 RepID=A0A512H4Z9_9PROT|nr:hypothetical protein [Pararhodospirillum oryzae]GEO80545.1 hypothetical protein ROR02_06760 [Pararhodospirillum oryzae]
MGKGTGMVGAGLLVAVLAGCGGGSPGGPAGPGDEAGRAAYRACQRYADDQAERRSGAFHGAGVDDMSAGDPRAQMAAYEARRAYDRALGECLDRQGIAHGRSPTQGPDSLERARDRLRW